MTETVNVAIETAIAIGVTAIVSVAIETAIGATAKLRPSTDSSENAWRMR